MYEIKFDCIVNVVLSNSSIVHNEYRELRSIASTWLLSWVILLLSQRSLLLYLKCQFVEAYLVKAPVNGRSFFVSIAAGWIFLQVPKDLQQHIMRIMKVKKLYISRILHCNSSEKLSSCNVSQRYRVKPGILEPPFTCALEASSKALTASDNFFTCPAKEWAFTQQVSWYKHLGWKHQSHVKG